MLDVFQVHYHLLSADNWQALNLSLACISQIQIDSSRRQCSCQSRAAQIRLKKSKRKTGEGIKPDVPSAALGVSFTGICSIFRWFQQCYSQPSSAHVVLWQLTAPGNYYLIKPGNFSQFGTLGFFFLQMGLFLLAFWTSAGVRGGESRYVCEVQKHCNTAYVMMASVL